jgi:DNA-binding transcriptional LysR family regulator
MLAGARPVVLRTSELEAQQAAARAGVGVAALPRFLGDRDGQPVRTNIASTSIAREGTAEIDCGIADVFGSKKWSQMSAGRRLMSICVH